MSVAHNRFGTRHPAEGCSSFQQTELERCLRDLMSLTALPEPDAGVGPVEIVERYCEALETLLPLTVCAASVCSFAKGHARLSVLRVQGEATCNRDHWSGVTSTCAAFCSMAPTTATVDTPSGPLRMVTLGMGYGDESGSLAVGAIRMDFPSRTESALLRTAVSLAASRLKTARLAYEREEALRAKDEFLAMLAHELRTPLTSIATALALMKLRGDVKTDGEQQIIRRQVQNITRLVDDLMDASSIARGTVTLHVTTVELSTVLMNAIEMAWPILEQRRHQLTIDVPTRPLLWCGDASRLAQVVANLLTNAARYTPPHGVIALVAARDNDTITIGVTDNGNGIPAELLPRVFELWVQGQRQEGGLGIGLSLVRHLVHLHGGHVVAKSDGPGKGSEFLVRLPAPAIPSEHRLTASDAAAPRRPTYGIRLPHDAPT